MIGLSEENVKRLMDNKPILTPLDEVGFPNITLVVIGGKTEADIMEDLRVLGVQAPERKE